MIPPENTTAVTRGLREAFGVTEFEDISMLTKGQTSSLVFRIVVRGAPFLLKIITRPYDMETLILGACASAWKRGQRLVWRRMSGTAT